MFNTENSKSLMKCEIALKAYFIEMVKALIFARVGYKTSPVLCPVKIQLY